MALEAVVEEETQTMEELRTRFEILSQQQMRINGEIEQGRTEVAGQASGGWLAGNTVTRFLVLSFSCFFFGF